MKNEKRIKVLYIAPNRKPVLTDIENDLNALQGMVGGYIEALTLSETACIICNEEGKINGLPLNRSLKNNEGEIYEIIAGSFIIAGNDFTSGEFASITDEDAEKYKNEFGKGEVFMMSNGKIESIEIEVN